MVWLITIREMKEETGIASSNIYNLCLRYIIIIRYKNTIRQSYIYFGDTDIIDIVDTNEGKLHWIHENDLLELEYTKTFSAMLKHYLNTLEYDKIVVGVAENVGRELFMTWSVVEDFE